MRTDAQIAAMIRAIVDREPDDQARRRALAFLRVKIVDEGRNELECDRLHDAFIAAMAALVDELDNN